VTRDDKVNFCMRIESKTGEKRSSGYVDDGFVLSAKRVGDDFYISQYAAFPGECKSGELPQHRYCAMLRKRTLNGFSSFHLCLTGLREETMGSVSHSFVKSSNPKTDIRRFRVQIPQPTHPVDSKYVWDLDTPIRCYPQNSCLSRDKCVSFIETLERKTSNKVEAPVLRLSNKLPEWDPVNECYVMKFLHKRVRMCSKKNILLHQSSSEGAIETPVLQFGKRDRSETRSTFVLDFRHPLSPIQAFSIALSGFAFTEQR